VKQSPARLVKSPNIVAYWQGHELVLEEFLRRRRVSAAPVAVQLLAAFTRPRRVSTVMRSFRPYSPRSVAREIRCLKALGFLVNEHDRPSRRDATAAWEGALPAAYYHFATCNVPYLKRPQETLEYLRGRLRAAPQPLVYKQYHARPRVALPKTAPRAPDLGLWTVLHQRRTVRRFSRRDVDLEDLAHVLGGTWGQTGWIEAGPFGRLLAKTSPSAGARHPVECYVVAWRVSGLAPGLYHYSVRRHALERLRAGDFRREAVGMAGGQSWVASAAFLCVMTAQAARVFWKYASADAYRLFLLDAGHLAQTFALLAVARGLGPFTTAAMNENTIERAFALDPVSELPLYLCGAGIPHRQAEGTFRPLVNARSRRTS
jgi:SagB-type dehydrogenase family enzyme